MRMASSTTKIARKTRSSACSTSPHRVDDVVVGLEAEHDGVADDHADDRGLEPRRRLRGGRRGRAARSRGGCRPAGSPPGVCPCRQHASVCRPLRSATIRAVGRLVLAVHRWSWSSWRSWPGRMRGAAPGRRAQGPRAGRSGASGARSRGAAGALPRRRRRALRGRAAAADSRGARGAVRVGAAAGGARARGVLGLRRRRAPSAGAATLPAGDGRRADRHVRLRGGRADRARRLPRAPARTRTSSTSATPGGSRTGRARARSCWATRAQLYGVLEARGVKLVVVACNSATAAALPALQREARLPVLGVVTPEAAHAAVAGDAQPARRPAGDGGHGGQRALRGGDPRPRRRHRGGCRWPCPGLAEAIQGEQPVLGAHRRRWCAACLRAAARGGGRHGDPRLHALPAGPAPMLQRESWGRTWRMVAAAEELAREVCRDAAAQGLGQRRRAAAAPTPFLARPATRREFATLANAVPAAPRACGRDRAGRRARLTVTPRRRRPWRRYPGSPRRVEHAAANRRYTATRSTLCEARLIRAWANVIPIGILASRPRFFAKEPVRAGSPPAQQVQPVAEPRQGGALRC